LCLRASAAGVGLRRSTARTILTVYDRIGEICLWTDGSFVGCDGVEDVESGGQSIVDDFGRRKKRGSSINFAV
jgi:hypothetical protein